jgi:hypothetical protein
MAWLREWLRACALLFLLVPARAALPVVVERPPEDVLIFTLSLDSVTLGEGFPAYPAREGYLIPFGEFCRELELGIQVDPALGSADGCIIEERRRFHLDLRAGTVTCAGRTQALDPGAVELHSDDIYVATGTLGQWLPLDVTVDFPHLALVVTGREPLPIELRWRRENLAPGPAPKAAAPPVLCPEPYGAADLPFVDQTLLLGGAARSSGQPPFLAQSSTLASGDLLHATGQLYNLLDSHSGRTTWLTLGRQDPHAGLLGPLRATRFAVGETVDPGLDLVFQGQPGNGAVLSNLPLDRSASTLQHSFRGSLAQGWEVELYRNQVLLGFQESRPDGSYEFLNVPLQYGRNDFVLVFYGPQSQRREESFSFDTSVSQVPRGFLGYEAAELRPKSGGTRAHLQTRYGLSDQLDASFALASGDRGYATAGVNGFAGVGAGSVTAAWDATGGSVLDLAGKTRFGGLDLSLRRAFLWGGFQEEISSLVGLGFGRVYLANNLIRSKVQNGAGFTEQTEGQLLGSLTLNDSLIRVQADYQQWGRPYDYSLQWQRSLSPSLLVRSALALSPGAGDRSLTLGLERHGGRVGLGVSLGYSTLSRASVAVALRAGLDREPREGTVQIRDQSGITAQGAVSVRVFLDTHDTGTMAPDDPLLAGVAVLVNGVRCPQLTDDRGVLFLDGLPVTGDVTLAILQGSLTDPLMRPYRPAVRITPRPGHVTLVDLPVVIHGEVVGTAYVRSSGADRTLPGLKLELVDSAGRVVKSIRTEFDGYYQITDVPPGSYRLQVPGKEAARLGLQAPVPRDLRFEPAGTSLDDVDLVLAPLGTGLDDKIIHNSVEQFHGPAESQDVAPAAGGDPGHGRGVGRSGAESDDRVAGAGRPALPRAHPGAARHRRARPHPLRRHHRRRRHRGHADARPRRHPHRHLRPGARQQRRKRRRRHHPFGAAWSPVVPEAGRLLRPRAQRP